MFDFKVNLRDVGWSGDWYVFEDDIRHGSGDGPAENPADYPDCWSCCASGRSADPEQTAARVRTGAG